MSEIKKGTNKFYLGESDTKNIAKITWVPGGQNIIVVNHTFVDPSLRGQNIAGQLLAEVVKMAREENLKIVPTCSYVIAKMTRTDEYKDILLNK
jgi:predicted GNAT family acetyltransferase